jgi:hypothetical protein
MQMDRSDKLQDNPNIQTKPTNGPMKAIPTYALYGELRRPFANWSGGG